MQLKLIDQGNAAREYTNQTNSNIYHESINKASTTLKKKKEKQGVKQNQRAYTVGSIFNRRQGGRLGRSHTEARALNCGAMRALGEEEEEKGYGGEAMWLQAQNCEGKRVIRW